MSIACRCWMCRWTAPTTIIGDRAFARDPATIIDLGRAQIEGPDGGRRAAGDEAYSRPWPRQGPTAIWRCPASRPGRRNSAPRDFVTFRSLNQCPMAMTAHVVYESIDPQRPATTSPKVIRDVIRGEIGFDGLLMSDDLSMKALDGPLSVRAKAALFAGCDLVLHCNGKMEEMREVAAEAKALEGTALKRAQARAGASVARPRRSIPRRPKRALARASGTEPHDRDRREPFDDFESVGIGRDEALVVTVDGFEGPLDLLLTLARNQKVDIAKISILKLADQYLEFIEAARKSVNLELAADYLVMAAWLAYLKSRLILPQDKGPDGEPTADEMATRLRWRLQRLDAMRAAATRLMGRERLDRDVFGRGDPEPVNVVKLRTYKDTLYDLLTAYATDRVRKLGGKTYQPPAWRRCC